MYRKDDAVMTRGLGILSMLCLHLFCRLGEDIVYKPLIWVKEGVPLAYWFGFFSEICVPIYTLCAGYARYMLLENNNTDAKNTVFRILKLLKNYWILLGLLLILGLLFDQTGEIPGSLTTFLKSILLIHTYTGIWWYLKTYLILLVIPASIVLWPIKRVSPCFGMIACICIAFMWEMVRHFALFQYESKFMSELVNLITVLPYYWCGAIICRGKFFDKLNKAVGSLKHRNQLLIGGVLRFSFV